MSLFGYFKTFQRAQFLEESVNLSAVRNLQFRSKKNPDLKSRTVNVRITNSDKRIFGTCKVWKSKPATGYLKTFQRAQFLEESVKGEITL